MPIAFHYPKATKMMRFLSAFLVSVTICFSNSLPAAATQIDPAYRPARQAFAALPLSLRYEIQMFLAATGYWAAVSNEDMGLKLFDAVRRFENANSLSNDGMLDARELAILRAQAAPVFTTWRLEAIRHPITGARLWVPAGLALKAKTNDRSQIEFNSEKNGISILYFSAPNEPLEISYNQIRSSLKPGERLVYSVLRSDFYVTYIEDGNVRAYTRVQATPDALTGFLLVWHGADNQVMGDRLATIMSDLFRAEVGLRVERSPPFINVNQEAAPSLIAAGEPAKTKERSSASSGTGFFVNDLGYAVTNNHVVEGCKSLYATDVTGLRTSARLIARDETSDLAVIRTEHRPQRTAILRRDVRLGENVSAFGFPLRGFLASGGNFTLGNVTALAGLGDDLRRLQISAPVQPGNSGGALLDKGGATVGVVASKLDTLMVAGAIDDVVQNVNFAVKTSVLVEFLTVNGVNYMSSDSISTERQPEEIAELAREQSIFIECN